MMTRSKIKKCPICYSTKIEHKLDDHLSKLRGITHNVPQTICHDCGEIFLGQDSLKVIRSNEEKNKHKITNFVS